MKKSIALLMTGLMVLSLAACGSKAPAAEESAPSETAAEATTEAAAEAASEQMTGLANPWSDITEEEANGLVPNLFSVPEGATNVTWSKMVAGDDVLVQVTFDLDGRTFTAREQSTATEEPSEISGLYYEWTVVDDVTLANWADGNMTGKDYRYIGNDKTVDLITWYDVETGYTYSLSTEDKDLDGFDIQAIAEAMYDPAKQESAMMPADEEHVAIVDPSKFATFTEIVDSLPAEAAYANATIDGTDVLLVTEYTYDYDGDGKKLVSIESDVYYYDENGAVAYAGYVTSGGTSYPLTIVDGTVYVGGNHYVKKVGLKDGKLVDIEEVYVNYDKDGNATYFSSKDDKETQLEDDTELNKFYDEMFEGELVTFSKVG